MREAARIGFEMIEISREKIEAMICNIMYEDGPDRHTDGSDVITSLIVAFLDGKYQEISEAFDKLKKMQYSNDILDIYEYYWEFKPLFHKDAK